MKKTTRQISALLAGVLLAGSAAAGGIRSPSMLANTCAGCHGTNGASAGDLMPIIGGLDKAFLQTVLMEYKSGERDSTIMGRIAKGYSDNEIKAMAAYFAAQPWVSAPIEADPKLAEVGKELHEKKCKTCHEEGGRVQEDESPRLAGQWPDYALLQLEICHKKGRRCAPRKMGKRVMKMSHDDLKALSQYYLGEK